jgi:hypothetical protein
MTPFDAHMQPIIERRKFQRSPLPAGSLLSFAPIAASDDSAQQSEGEGIILDISQGGCRVNSEHLIVLEQPYSLIIQLPYYPNPVTIESAIARWISKQSFGMMFIAMQREQERCLSEFLDYLRSDAA